MNSRMYEALQNAITFLIIPKGGVLFGLGSRKRRRSQSVYDCISSALAIYDASWLSCVPADDQLQKLEATD